MNTNVNLYAGTNRTQRKQIDLDLARRLSPKYVYLTGVITPPVLGLPPGTRSTGYPPIGPAMGKSRAYVVRHGFPTFHRKVKS